MSKATFDRENTGCAFTDEDYTRRYSPINLPPPPAASSFRTMHKSKIRPATRSIPGLFAASEIVGGLFYHNYASGTGLMSGAVFGRRAGKGIAAWAKA